MKLHTPEKTVLIEISTVKPDPAGLLIEGKIMGALPMRAILTPGEARRGLRVLSGAVLLRIVSMLWRGKST